MKPHRRIVLLACAALGAACTSNAAPATTAPIGTASPNDPFLDTVQTRTFHWFWDNTDPRTGLTPDRWPARTFSSVGAIGFGLSSYIVGAERGYVSRAEAADRALATLKYLWQLPQGSGTTGVAGYQGFFYHFLRFDDGLRFEHVELSSIDTALLLIGALSCEQYFDGSSGSEPAVRAYADSLYRRANWQWFASPKPPGVAMGWHPETSTGQGNEFAGFNPYNWVGYDEGMLLYVLALGSPTFPIDSTAWDQWTSGYQWREYYGQAHVNFPPLFGHEYSHVWIDFRGIQDAFMRAHGIDYFENTRRATYAQRSYAIENPNGWTGYGATVWGLTAADGAKDTTLVVDGRTRNFFTYRARGAAATGVEDDGTLAPTAAGGSIPFAPEIALPALKEMRRRYGSDLFGQYGFVDAFNPTYRFGGRLPAGKIVPNVGWFDTDYLGIDQGPILLMIENYRTGLIWKLMRSSPYIRRGLERAGFTGGWLVAK
jgi:hypothetical protein